MGDVDLTGLTEKVTRGRWETTYYEDMGGNITAKKCRKCTEIKNIKSFYSEKSGLGGKSSHCKECKKGYRREAYEEDPDKIRKYDRMRYAENPNKFLRKSKKYREDNKEYFREYNRSYYESVKDQDNYKDKVREYGKKWRAHNKERIAEVAREWREKNIDRCLENSRTWYENNKNRKKLTQREWYRLNNSKAKLISQNRRARKRSLPHTLTLEQQEINYSYFNEGCSLSGNRESIDLEHIIPINICHGGTIKENCIPMRDTLNYSKGNKNIFEWFPQVKERYGLSQCKFDELIAYLAELNGLLPKEYEDFVYWCHANPRTVEETEADNEYYGYKKPSIELWREATEGKAIS